MSLILIAAMIMIAATGCTKGNTVGSGSKQFTFTVVDKEKSETTFTVKSDKQTVGEALLDEKLIEGDESQYGLYVTKVNGIEAVYENDGTYWAFYINDEYAMTGVDSTDIVDGAKYSFKVES